MDTQNLVSWFLVIVVLALTLICLLFPVGLILLSLGIFLIFVALSGFLLGFVSGTRIFKRLTIFVIGADNKALRRKVTLSQKVGEYILVTEGLNQGDRLVVEGYENLEEGTSVDIRKEIK